MAAVPSNEINESAVDILTPTYEEPIIDDFSEPKKNNSRIWIVAGLILIAGIGFGAYSLGSGEGYYYSMDKSHSGEVDEYKDYTNEQLLELADKNDLEAIRQLGLNSYAEEDYTSAFNWVMKAAEQGYAPAQFNVGECYQEGIGVEKDTYKVFEWYMKAAEQGYACAQNEVGVCYFKGIGVEENLDKAIEWFKKAAEQGYAPAQYNVGICYYRGVGVEENLDKAIEWFKKAAEQGNADAQQMLESLKR